LWINKALQAKEDKETGMEKYPPFLFGFNEAFLHGDVNVLASFFVG
jgi:hypothetical protein